VHTLIKAAVAIAGAAVHLLLVSKAGRASIIPFPEFNPSSCLSHPAFGLIMDPLSVLASVTGILNVAAKVTQVLSDFIQKERGAPTSCRNIIAEVSALSVCLAQLAPILQGTEQAPQSRQAAISLGQVIVVNTSCVLTLSELEKILDSFKLNQPMPTLDKVRWTRTEPTIIGILDRIRASKSSLNLILTILTW